LFLYKQIMLKKLLITAFLFLTQLNAIDIPNNFYIEQPVSINENCRLFMLKEGKERVGFLMRIEGETLAYKLYSKNAFIEARTAMHPAPELKKVIFDVFDSEKNLIGSIVEDWSGSFVSFELFSAEGALIAKGGQDFWGITFLLVDPYDEHPLVSMVGSFKTWNYEVQILDPSWLQEVDARLILLFLPFSNDAQTLHKEFSK
jgi:hypothetical protein